MKKFVLLFFLFAGVAVAAPPTNLYFYKAEFTKEVTDPIYDGDTVRVDIDLGLGLWKKNEQLRLHGIDAPERRGSTKVAGLAAKDHLESLTLERELIVETLKDDEGKYGRLIAVLWVKGLGIWCPLGKWCNVNDQMVKDGHAVYRSY